MSNDTHRAAGNNLGIREHWERWESVARGGATVTFLKSGYGRGRIRAGVGAGRGL